MKRVITALVLIVLVVVLCVVSIVMQERSLATLLTMTDDMQKAYDAGDLDTCLQLSNQFVTEYPKRTRFFPFFMRHSDVAAIEDTAAVLPVMLETGNDDHFAIELARCRSQLEHLARMETPTLENIF